MKNESCGIPQVLTAEALFAVLPDLEPVLDRYEDADRGAGMDLFARALDGLVLLLRGGELADALAPLPHLHPGTPEVCALLSDFAARGPDPEALARLAAPAGEDAPRGPAEELNDLAPEVMEVCRQYESEEAWGRDLGATGFAMELYAATLDALAALLRGQPISAALELLPHGHAGTVEVGRALMAAAPRFESVNRLLNEA